MIRNDSLYEKWILFLRNTRAESFPRSRLSGSVRIYTASLDGSSSNPNSDYKSSQYRGGATFLGAFHDVGHHVTFFGPAASWLQNRCAHGCAQTSLHEYRARLVPRSSPIMLGELGGAVRFHPSRRCPMGEEIEGWMSRACIKTL